MSWIAASLALFVFSVCVYIAVRKSALDGLSSQFNNLAMFAIPLPIFLVIGTVAGCDFMVSAKEAAEIAGTAIVFAYTGNALSMKSISLAANPGYSLMLSKSYVVLTTTWAVVFFNSPLTIRAAFAIAIILLSSILIATQTSKTTGRKNGPWLLPAIGAFFCWGFLALAGKQIQSGGVATPVFLTYLFAIVNICILVEMRLRHLSLDVVSRNPWPFIFIGAAAAGFNFFGFYAIKVAPNVGYVNAVNAASIGAVTLCAVVFFHDELTRRKAIGIAGMLAGLLLLLI